MNEQNNHAALTIAQQYPPTQYNLLVPMQTVTEIADIQKPVMNSVSISTNLNDGEIYEMEKAKDEWRDSKGYVHKATPAKYALTKKGLTKLMRAAGIKILSSRPVVPSTCQKCAEVNRSIGKPIRCGGCPNKDVKHEVRISVPQLTGENVTIVAHKEIAVEDVTAGMTEKQRAEFMKFRSEMCESKALNRALRTAMQIKSSYLIEEFKKPFVVAYLVPNLDNPAVREEAVKSMFGAANELYGSRPKTSHTVYVDDDDDGYANAWVNVADLLHVREGTEGNYKYHMAYLPDPTKYAGGTVSSDYVQLDFEMPGQDGYVKELGKDPRYPFIRVTKTIGGSSSTYYADYYWYGRNAVNAVLAGGNLNDGRGCGPRSFYCNNAPSTSSWYRRARLS